MNITKRMSAILFSCALLFLSALGSGAPAFQKAKSGELAGKWQGNVTAGDAAMGITLELKAEGDKLTGRITNPHGSWQVTDVKFAGGKWTIGWRTPEGSTGKMIGMLKDNKLAGDWDFSPAFVGTFELSKDGSASSSPAEKKGR